jgi:riboflavin kinase / FMN adenylyltransferase
MRFTSRVLKGQGRGKTLGFPTFNLQIPPDLKSKSGIYAGYVWINNQPYKGAFHYGPIPVFSDLTPHLEVFVLDFSSNSPITQLTFELVTYLRPIRNFPNLTSLTRQISRDVTRTRQLLLRP